MKNTLAHPVEHTEIVASDQASVLLRADKWESTRLAGESLRRHQDELKELEADRMIPMNLERLLKLRFRINWEAGSINEVCIESERRRGGEAKEEREMLKKLWVAAKRLSTRADNLLERYIAQAYLEARDGNYGSLQDLVSIFSHYIEERDKDPY